MTMVWVGMGEHLMVMVGHCGRVRGSEIKKKEFMISKVVFDLRIVRLVIDLS